MKIQLNNVRLSFPKLFKPEGFKGQAGSEKFSAAFLLDKEEHAEKIKEIKEAIKKVVAEKWPKKAPKLAADKIFLKDGEIKEDEYDGYDSSMVFINASTTKRPVVVDKKLTPIAEDDDVIYAGCYVNATFQIWAQDNDYGKRINAQLRAVQFERDGEPFGAAPVEAEAEFGAAEEFEDEGILG